LKNQPNYKGVFQLHSHLLEPRPPDGEPARLALLPSPILNLRLPASDHIHAAWQAATSELARQGDIEIGFLPRRSAFRLRHLMVWAKGMASHPSPPVFAPWQCWSADRLQTSKHLPVPSARWISAYPCISIGHYQAQVGLNGPMLMSPLAAGCVLDEPCPRPDVLQAMIEAGIRENRRKITIITDARRRNRVIMNLLLPNLAKTRDRIPIEVLLIENARDDLARDPRIGEAIITLPDLRSGVIAILSESGWLNGPWPLLWHDQQVCMISSECLPGMPHALPLDRELLVHALALAAQNAGHVIRANQLLDALASLRDCGNYAASATSPSFEHAKSSDEDFIDHFHHSVTSGGSPDAAAQVILQRGEARKSTSPPCLTLVRSPSA
jgi:hypothetical protein